MSRIEAQRLLWALHARTPQHRRRVRRLREALDAVPAAAAYVSFSAGKDSAVLAHAAHAAHPGIPMWMIDPGVPDHWLASERERWLAYAAEHGWRLRLFAWDKWGAVRGAASERQHRQQAHAAMFAALEEQARAEGRSHVLMGLRAQESPGRRASLATHGETHTNAGGITRHCPLGLWTHEDIWAYTIEHGLPWLDVYDKLGPVARNGLIGRNGVRHGRMAYLRSYFPEAYRHARDVLGLDYARHV